MSAGYKEINPVSPHDHALGVLGARTYGGQLQPVLENLLLGGTDELGEDSDRRTRLVDGSLDFFKGLLLGVPLSLVLWGVVFLVWWWVGS